MKLETSSGWLRGQRGLALLTCLLLLPFAAPADLTLAANGKSSYRIVVATNAIPSERYAAEELQQDP